MAALFLGEVVKEPTDFTYDDICIQDNGVEGAVMQAFFLENLCHQKNSFC